MKANHNVQQIVVTVYGVVIKERKSKVWKQITTPAVLINGFFWLLSKNVNLKFESKSQHATSAAIAYGCCYQRT